MTTTASFTYSAKSAAIRAAKKSGLEPAEFTIKQTPDGRFAIEKIAALMPAAYAAPAAAATTTHIGMTSAEKAAYRARCTKSEPAHNTPADRGAAAAKQDDAERIKEGQRITANRLAAEAIAKNAELDAAARLKDITEGRVGKTITANRIKRFADQRAAAKPAPTPAPDCADIFGINKPNNKHRTILALAQGGTRPKAPDLSAPAHDYYRRFLIAMEAAIAKGDLAEMQSICDRMKSKIYCSSRTRIRAYGLLSIIAMRAKH